MEAVGAGASILAFVSIAIQLQKLQKQICTLIRSIKEAPNEVQSILAEVELVGVILKEIQRCGETSELTEDAFNNALKSALERCRKPMDFLHALAQSFVEGLNSKSRLKRKITAIDVARKSAKIKRFQEILQTTKHDLSLVQGTLVLRTMNHYQIMNQGSLIALQHTVDDLYDYTSSTRVVTNGDLDASALPSQTTTDVREVPRLTPIGQLQSKLEAQMAVSMKAAVASVLREVDPRLPDSLALVKAPILISSGRRLVGTYEYMKVQTIFGDFWSISAKYRNSPQSDSRSQSHRQCTGDEIKVETTFGFVPSQWLIELGLRYAIQTSSQGWQKQFRVFNIVPRDSQILQYCREGDIDAVRHLVKNRQASVNDMNEFGETGLHLAAANGHSLLCSALLDMGASLSTRTAYGGRSFTPFALACRPLECEDTHICIEPQVPHTRQFPTIREFIVHGEDLEEAADAGYYYSLLEYESTHNKGIHKKDLTSTWIFEDALPASYTCSIDKRWWNMCLRRLIMYEHPAIFEVVKQCDLTGTRQSFLQFMYFLGLETPRDFLQERFDFLIKYAGGLCFAEELNGRLVTPLSVALKSSNTFSRFHVLLINSKCDIMEIVRAESAFQGGAWSEEALLALFELDFSPFDLGGYPKTHHDKCTSCKFFTCRLQQIWDYPWQKVMRRLRDGISLVAPDTEEETLHKNAWFAAQEAYEAGICLSCFVKNFGRQWPFLEQISTKYCE